MERTHLPAHCHLVPGTSITFELVFTTWSLSARQFTSDTWKFLLSRPKAQSQLNLAWPTKRALWQKHDGLSDISTSSTTRNICFCFAHCSCLRLDGRGFPTHSVVVKVVVDQTNDSGCPFHTLN